MSSRRTAPADSKADTISVGGDIETAEVEVVIDSATLEATDATAAYTIKKKVRTATVIKDIIIGIYLGVIFICISIILDYYNVVHFQSAHHFRNSAYQMLNDPETIANIEESAELKFIQQTEYESIRKEIDGVSKQLADRNEYLQDQIKVEDENQKQIDSIQSEHTDIILKSKTVLELDKFCGECSWAGKVTCNDRVAYLMTKYKDSAPKAKVGAMEVASCKNQTSEEE